MNFEKDLREQITQLLKEDDITFNKQDSTCGLLISYLNAVNRRIPVNKRKVFISDKINKIIYDNKLDKKYIEALLKFKCNFENGINMNCHLSTGIFCSNISVSKNNKKYMPSRDYLLDDWGIHHLHLDEKEAKNKKEMHNNRSEYLLFVKITNNETYFIDIMKHKTENFCKQELLETLDRNWHFILEKYMLPELISIPKMTDMEIKNRRKNNEYRLYKINDKVYIPIGGGVTSAGTNRIHTENADNILNDIRIIEEDITNNHEMIKNEIEAMTGLKCSNKKLKFKFILDKNGYVVKEINTGYATLYFYEGDCIKKRSGIIMD